LEVTEFNFYTDFLINSTNFSMNNITFLINNTVFFRNWIRQIPPNFGDFQKNWPHFKSCLWYPVILSPQL
jgi:hypothetical protein